MNTYIVGQLVELRVAFADQDGNPVDPDDVTCIIRLPDMSIVDDLAIQHPGSGIYLVQYAPTQNGLHVYRFDAESASVDVSAQEGQFLAQTQFPEEAVS